MMYQNKFATAIKVGGKIMREQGESVLLPFGTEYSILLKNLNSVKAVVRVEIDGTDVTGGSELIIDPNSSVYLERFVSAAAQGNKFKFIERTAKIEQHRGAKIDDGIVRISFEFEQPAAMRIPSPIYEPPYRSPYNDYWLRNPIICQISGSLGNDTESKMTYTKSDSPLIMNMGAASASLSSESPLRSANLSNVSAEAGITVKGSISDQRFTTTTRPICDGQKHVMIFKLLGQIGETAVEKPVTVSTKTECSTCGTKNKFGSKFCRDCGTALELL